MSNHDNELISSIFLLRSFSEPRKVPPGSNRATQRIVRALQAEYPVGWWYRAEGLALVGVFLCVPQPVLRPDTEIYRSLIV